MGREFERGRRQVARRQFQGEQAEIGGARQFNDQRPRRCGQRIQLERRRHDDAEAAERSGQQPRQIVTGDVLDDDPAALGKTSVRSRELDADDQVARRSVSMPPRSAVIGGNDAADCGAIRRGRIERNPLAVRREHPVHVPERRSGLDCRRQVAMAVRNDSVEPGG